MKKDFPNISPHVFEHPLDRTALLSLQKVPGIDWVVKTLFSIVGEKRLRLFFLASSVRVNEKQLPRLHKNYLEACRILDVKDPPELFVAQKMAVNAAAIGMGKPFIMLTSPLVDALDDDELQCVIGHELGHVLCGHSLYTTILLLLVSAWYAFIGIPGGLLAITVIRMALLEWSRKAELTADRAGLLVSQDADVSYRVAMKLAGGRPKDEMSIEEFFKQAEEYREGGNVIDGVLKIALLLGQTHPLPVLRVSELRDWVDSGDYQKILSGDYLHRDENQDDDFIKNIKAAASSYKDAFKSSKDPFISTVKDISNSVANTGREIFEFFKRATDSWNDKHKT
ncbi:MAG: M48 family metallopeptidase [Deltaproteobacteria bacterium]|nr:M48 family metallopeptidase [Deltaproteobacteria bacterium]